MPTRAGKRHGLRRRLAGKALAWGARWYLKRNKPVVVGIAGVRGKTVFKRIVADLLERKWNTRSNILSYNTEIGLPLSILRLKLPRTFTQKGFFPLDLLYKAAVVRDRTEMLVLEYGIANREDAVNLKAIASPDWLVICDISSSDLSLDHRSILEGIRHIAAGVPEERIFWPMEDARLQELGVPLLSEMGVDSSQLKDERLHTPEGVYPLEREFVGRSAQLGALAAVRLGEKLGMTKPEIERFLGG